jgi:hypothetical protein
MAKPSFTMSGAIPFCEVDCLDEAALGFEVLNQEKEDRYRVRRTILGDPHQNCLLVHTSLEVLRGGHSKRFE